MDVIDARGLKCPLPVLRLAQTLRALTKGAVVTLWADDPVAVIDVPHFCAETGHILISQGDEDGYQTYQIEHK